ncbi:MAG: TetR/AcrR family transcriptional regulator [Calditrichaeota bacterium]|nr:TetR/AcrR family transcriptional regulator [Calditrichota bacterium]
MGISERREREKQQRRNDIVDAAEDLFFSHGFETTTMDQVADKAEFSKGTLYLYFKNKDDLYTAINARGLKVLVDLFVEAKKKGDSGFEKIKRITEAYHTFFHDYHNYFNVMLTCENRPDNTETDQEDSKYGYQAIQEVAEAVAIGVQDGSLKEGLEPVSTAITLWAQSTGIFQVVHSHGQFIQEGFNLDTEKLIEDSMHLIHSAIAKY